MKKILQMLALVALMAIPWAANAQSGCNIRVAGIDSYGDGWNGGSLDISQGGTSLSTFTLSSGASGETTVVLPTSDPVTFTWTSGSYDSEVTINIYDGGNTLVQSVSSPSAGVIYTMSSPCPSCLPATDLTASNVTTDGMTVSWTDATNSGSYTLSYWKNEGDTTTVSLTTTSYTLTGLEANSYYNFSVVTNCSSTDQSSPLTGEFVTACGGSTCDLTLELGSSSSYSDPFTYYSGPASVELFQGGASLGAFSSTTTVQVCGTDTIVVKYNHSGYSWGDYYDNYASITIRDGGGVAVYSGGMGDTLCVIGTPCPTCIPPTALTVVPDSNEITFSWTPRSDATQFIVYLNNTVVNDNVSDTFYVFTGLNANTQYTVSVQSVCSYDDSSSIASRTVRTACGQITLPYFVDFEDAAYNGAWYPCWDSTIHAGTDPSVNDQNSPANHTTGGTYAMYLQGNSSEQYNLIVTPLIPTAGNNIYVRFWARASYSGWIKAGVMTNPYDTTTFIPMVNVEGNSWNEYEFRTDTLDALATYYVAWLGHGSGFIGKFDDVYISEAPSCARVPEASIDTTTSDAITLSWADNGSNSYTVYYWANGSTDTLTTSTTDTTITLSGLSAMTGYNMMVVANCSGGDAEPSPVYSAATTCAASTCNLTAYVTDSYNDSWNGCGINIVQAGVIVGTIECPSGQSGSSFTYEVCSSAPVKFTFVRGSYPNELGGYIQDGGGNTVYTISSMSSYYTGDSLGYVATPCPDCVPPTSVYLSDTTASGVTIHWTAQEGQTAWIVRVDSTDVNVTDTFYTVSTLAERTVHTIGVATDCSGDTSAFTTLSFVTGCVNGECEITITSTDQYGYGSGYSPKLHVYQNGSELATVQYATETVDVCPGMPVNVIYEAPNYTYSTPMATIVNGGDEEVFNGATSNYSTGDTLVYMANACPSCLKPMGVAPVVVDSTQITFSWTVESGYTYLISFDDAAYTANNTGAYTAYGLTPNTLHTFAVKTVCALGDTSNARIISVKTACGEMAIPYTESFEGDAQGNVPSCWTVVSDGANGFPAIDDNGHTGNHSLTFVSNTTNTAMIASSRIPLPGDSIKVSFWAFKDYGYGTLEAGMMTNPYVDSTFISMVNVTASDYTLYEFNTNTLSPDSTYYLAFRYAYNYDYYWAKVDDINITLDEGCMTPTNVTATPDTVTPNINVTWTNNGSTSSFVVEYRTSGATSWSMPIYTGLLSTNITGLAYATTYEIRVGQLCGSDTLWSATTTASTVCGMAALPYIENFVSATGELPPCWNYTTPSYFHWNRWTTHAETSGDGEMMVGNGSAGEAAILPFFEAPLVKLQISFKAKLGNVSEGDGMMMGAYNETTGTVEWLDTLTNLSQSRENFVEFSYNYLNYTGSGTRVAIGHSHNNPSDWGFAIDSIVVVELVNCNPPENLEVHNTMYPNTADDVYFTWTVSTSGTNVPSEWELYYDTITSTIDIDSVAESALIQVDTTYYMPPINSLAEGAHYRLFVRSKCGNLHSDWVELQNGFSTDEFWMNNTSSFDTIVGCDFIIYDNGGPVAGYMHNSNSNLVIQAGEPGRELQLQGAFFSHGADANTFTVYDGIGTTGTVLYTRNNTNMTETIDSVLATSTTGAMTITFTSGYYAALGYELYIHCIGAATCTKPTNLQVEMIGAGTAYATWDSTGASLYRVYHHTSGDSVWNMNPSYTNSITLTGLPIDVNYDFYVVAYCSDNDFSAPSIIRHFNTHWVEPCNPVENITVNNISQTGATLAWASTASLWEVALTGGTIVTTTSPTYTFSDLTSNTEYNVRVRAVCDTGYYSDWSDTITFSTLPNYYIITVTSNNNDWGTASGSGSYAEGTQAHLVASPTTGYYFVEWQEDHNTDADRSVTVTADATYTAVFAPNQGIDEVENGNVTLFPNPASTNVTISGIDGESIVTLVDMNGREVYKANANNTLTIDLSGYAKGAYFVRITGDSTSAIRKLIVK